MDLGSYSIGVHFLYDIFRKWTPIEYGPQGPYCIMKYGHSFSHKLLVVYVSTVESETDSKLNSKVQSTNWFCVKH